jgi:hypothetical protein
MKRLKIYLWIMAVAFALLFCMQLIRESVYRTDKTTRMGIIEAPKYCSDAFSTFELYRAMLTDNEDLLNAYWRKDDHIRSYYWFLADAVIFYLPFFLAVWLFVKRQRKELLVFLLAVTCLYNLFFLYHDIRLDLALRAYRQSITHELLPGFAINIVVKLFYIISTAMALLWLQIIRQPLPTALTTPKTILPLHLWLKRYLIGITAVYIVVYMGESISYIYDISGAQRWNLSKTINEHCWSPVSFSKWFVAAGTFGNKGAFDYSGGSLFNRQPVTIYDWFLFYLPLLLSLLYALFTKKRWPLMIMLGIVFAYNCFYLLYDKAAFASMYRDYLPSGWSVVSTPYYENQVIRAFYILSSCTGIVWLLWRRKNRVI